MEPELPKTTFVRSKDICECMGLTRDDLSKAVAAKVLHRFPLPGRKRGKYLRAEVLRVFGKEIGERG